MIRFLGIALLFFFVAGCHQAGLQSGGKADDPMVRVSTTKGDILVVLHEGKAPLSTANFLSYARSGFYNGTVFHRVMEDFMVQAGGYDPRLNRKPRRAPIKNEATNRLKNLRGTLAFARAQGIDSATSEFFINLNDNAHLDYKNPTASGYGYAVFGRVVEGMDVVDAIGSVPTEVRDGMENVPVDPIIILSVSVVEE